VIGGRLNAWGTNAKLGKGDFVVAEADESDGTFLLYSPTISLVTNIDTEHLDFYKDLDEIKETFLEFMNQVPSISFVLRMKTFRAFCRGLRKGWLPTVFQLRLISKPARSPSMDSMPLTSPATGVRN